MTAQAWDDSSRLVSRTDDNGNETVYQYDPLDRMTREVFADCTESSYVYDVHDNPTTITDANGSVTTCGYDLLDRLTGKTVTTFGPGVSHDTTAETFEYDGLSRLTYAEDDDSSVTINYDSLSNVIRDHQELTNGGEGTVTATFDGESNLLSCTYPGGRVIGCTYDALNRKQVITDDTGVGQNQSGPLIASYQYIGRYRVARRDYGNNTTMTYAYDGLSNQQNDHGVRQIVGTTHTFDPGGPNETILDQRTYAWDQMYNKKQRKDVRAGGPMLTHDYDYDPTYRLKHTLVTNGSPPATVRDTVYNLGGVHNRLSVDSALAGGAADPAAGNYTMNPTACTDRAMNQYTTTPTDLRGYDENGNLIQTTHRDGGVENWTYNLLCAASVGIGHS